MDTKELHALVERYLSGEATEAEKQKLHIWYASNFDEYRGIANEGAESDLSKERILENLRKRIPHVDRYLRQRQGGLQKRNWFIAASLIGILAVLGMLYFQLSRPYSSEADHDVVVNNPKGAMKEIYLPDGTHVWLNAGSTLQYPIRFGNNRQVNLNGEAYFDVVSDAGKPFTVRSGKLVTKVLGTAFNIKAYSQEDRVAVSVERGKVVVSDSARALATLASREQLSYSISSGKSALEKADLESILAWRKGELRFNAMRLKDIVAVLERWYDVKIQFENRTLSDCVYSAAFENTVALDDLLTMLCAINDIEYRYVSEKGTVSLFGNGCE